MGNKRVLSGVITLGEVVYAFTFDIIFFIRKVDLKSNKYIIFAMKSSELLRLLKQDGWFVIRQAGSHLIMNHPFKHGKIVFPLHGSKEVGKGLERKIKKNAGLNKDYEN